MIAIIGLKLALALWNELTRKDTTEDYVFLCERLFDDFKVKGVTPVMPSEAEQKVHGQKIREELSRISRHGKKLAPIAGEFPALFKSVEEINRNLPQGSKIFFGLAEAFLGAYTGQREHVGTGGQKALQETERGWDAYKALEALFNQKHVLAMKMAELVPQFSGPETNGTFLTASFAEHKPSFLPLDLNQRELLSLKNTSGRDLHNCAISVRVSNAAGKSYLNLHFVPIWLKDENRVAQYSDDGFPEDTVKDVTRVEVRVGATEFSTQPIVLEKPSGGWLEP